MNELSCSYWQWKIGIDPCQNLVILVFCLLGIDHCKTFPSFVIRVA
jgi:hypothetical protein